MANLSLNLPCPSSNGAGAATDLTTFGKTKTIVATGVTGCIVTIEINNDANSLLGSWAPVCAFRPGGKMEVVLENAGRFWRARTSGYKGGTPQIDVAGTDAGASFASIAVPAGPGNGAAVDVSALPMFKTVQVGGAFKGPLNVELSTDGNTDWATVATFQAPGQQSFVATGNWMRIVRLAPGTGSPICTVGAAEDIAGGGGPSSDATQYVFVFQPGGVAADNVYTDWASLYAALDAVEGQRILQWDTTFQPIGADDVPDGTYDMHDVTWTGYQGFDMTFVVLGNDVVFNNLFNIGSNLEVQWTGAAPMCPNLAPGATVRVFNARMSSTTAPIWDIQQDAMDVRFIFTQCLLAGSNGAEIVSVSATGVTINADFFNCEAFINTNSIIATADAVSTLNIRTTSQAIPGPQANWGGTTLYTQQFDTLQGSINIADTPTALTIGSVHFVVNTDPAPLALTLPPSANVMPGGQVVVYSQQGTQEVGAAGVDTINGTTFYTVEEGERATFTFRDGIAWFATKESATNDGPSPTASVKYFDDFITAVGLTERNGGGTVTYNPAIAGVIGSVRLQVDLGNQLLIGVNTANVATNGDGPFFALEAGLTFDVELRYRAHTVPAPGSDCITAIGIQDSAGGGIPADGMTFVLGIAPNGNTNWWAVNSSGGQDKADTGIAVNTAIFQRFGIRGSFAGPIIYSIDGVDVATLANNIPQNDTLSIQCTMQAQDNPSHTGTWDWIDSEFTLAR